MSGLLDDLMSDVSDLILEMDNQTREIHAAIDKSIDQDVSLDEAERHLVGGFRLYESANDLSGQILTHWRQSNGLDEPFAFYDYALPESNSSELQVLETLPLRREMQDYEDAVLRYVGVRDRIPIGEYGSIQDLMANVDVELPKGIFEKPFYGEVEIYRDAQFIG